MPKLNITEIARKLTSQGVIAAPPGTPIPGQVDTSGMDRALYIALLMSAADKAGNAAGFSLDLHMNDLFARLSNLKGNPEVAKIASLIEDDSAEAGEMQMVTRQLHVSAATAIRNLR